MAYQGPVGAIGVDSRGSRLFGRDDGAPDWEAMTHDLETVGVG